MPDAAHPADEPAAVAVRVLRTGGFAGLSREWSVHATAEGASRWILLIDRCPWPRDSSDASHTDGDSVPAGGADRFVWQVRARHPDCDERVAELADHEITGPWGELIEAVRNAERGGPAPT